MPSMETFERGTDCGNIAWVEVDGHRWHWWTPDGGWGHYPHHCPACQALVYHGVLPVATPGRHFGKDGHEQTWTGAAFVHLADECLECAFPTNVADPRLRPGRSPQEAGVSCP